MEEKKPFFLVKMTDVFDEPLAKFYFRSTVSYFPWKTNPSVLPPNLVERILLKLNSGKHFVEEKVLSHDFARLTMTPAAASKASTVAPTVLCLIHSHSPTECIPPSLFL